MLLIDLLYLSCPPIIDLIESKYSAIKVRPNPYRKIILNGLRGVYEDDRIQPFFVKYNDMEIRETLHFFGFFRCRDKN